VEPRSEVVSFPGVVDGVSGTPIQEYECSARGRHTDGRKKPIQKKDGKIEEVRIAALSAHGNRVESFHGLSD